MTGITLSGLFDLKDRKLLYELDRDCRLSDSQLGRKIRLSSEGVRYRINRLVKNNYITRFASVIDTYKLGFYKIKLYLRFHNADKHKIREITDYLIDDDKTEWIATCSGRWDLIAGFIVRSPYDFSAAVDVFENRFSSFISSREITISLGVPHWYKEYLLDNKPPFDFVMQGGSIGDYSLDDVDERIIKLVVNNARMPLVRMSRVLGISARSIDYRLKRLKKDGIILMQRIFLNLPKIGFIFCKALIKFKDKTADKQRAFFSACSSIPHLTYLINTLGSWDVELDFEVPDFPTFHNYLLSLRDKFSDIISHYDFVIVLNEEKLDYYPGAFKKL